MPSLDKTLEYLYGLERRGIRPGLGRVKTLLRLLGDPHRAFPSVLVAGTNGKGSTSAMIEAILMRAGYRVGLYTSPHLLRFNERIRVMGKDITDRDVARLARKTRRVLRQNARMAPTFFEFTTAMAFEHFRERKVDIAVLETGMGGRLDATNAAPALVTVITNVAMDHCEYLGHTIGDIAWEKAGVIKKGGVTITSAGGRALAVIRRVAGQRGSRLFVMGRDFGVSRGKRGFDYAGGEKMERLRTNLMGAHQVTNAGCAIKAVEALSEKGFPALRRAIRQGLMSVAWPCRFEVVSRRPLVVLDAAHNGHGAAALANTLKGLGPKRLVLVLGMMADKDIRAVMSELLPPAHTVIVTRPRSDRAAKTDALYNAAVPYGKRVLIREDVRGALKQALVECGKNGVVCVTGSIYTVGEAKGFLKRLARA